MYNPPVSLPHLLAPLVEAHYVDLTSIELVDAEDLVGLRHLSMLVIIVCVCARVQTQTQTQTPMQLQTIDPSNAYVSSATV